MPYVLENKEEGKYITYRKPDEEIASKRGAVMQTDNREDAYVFSSKKKAKSEKYRLSKKARNYEITVVEEGRVQEEKDKTKTIKRKQFSNNERKTIYRKTKGCCYLCGDFIDFDEFEVDHKIPIASGGTNNIDNLFCACHLCNSLKQSFPYEKVLEVAQKITKNHQKELADVEK